MIVAGYEDEGTAAIPFILGTRISVGDQRFQRGIVSSSTPSMSKIRKDYMESKKGSLRGNCKILQDIHGALPQVAFAITSFVFLFDGIYIDELGYQSSFFLPSLRGFLGNQGFSPRLTSSFLFLPINFYLSSLITAYYHNIPEPYGQRDFLRRHFSCFSSILQTSHFQIGNPYLVPKTHAVWYPSRIFPCASNGVRR